MDSTPFLSVVLLTYNQAPYVKFALDGILMQQTSFPFEVVVADDCSTDGTQEILKEYQEEYPDIFRLILREKNLGPTMNNYDVKKYARGKYFACLEGDDYWTDERKLQKQVDFLEEHSEYIACVHKCVFVDENNSPISSQPVNGYYYNGEIYTVKEFEKGLLPGQTATLVYRNIYLETDFDYSILYTASDRIGDKTAIMLLLSRGNIYCISDTMSCYRYIISKSGTNVSSFYIGKNNRDELMRYLTVLEKYASEELDMKIDMSQKKKEYFVAAVSVWYQNKRREDRQVLDSMLDCCGNKISYRMLMVKTVIIKWFAWNILKKDIRIKV